MFFAGRIGKLFHLWRKPLPWYKKNYECSRRFS